MKTELSLLLFWRIPPRLGVLTAVRGPGGTVYVKVTHPRVKSSQWVGGG